MDNCTNFSLNIYQALPDIYKEQIFKKEKKYLALSTVYSEK